jgi:hypothetical protein
MVHWIDMCAMKRNDIANLWKKATRLRLLWSTGYDTIDITNVWDLKRGDNIFHVVQDVECVGQVTNVTYVSEYEEKYLRRNEYVLSVLSADVHTPGDVVTDPCDRRLVLLWPIRVYIAPEAEGYTLTQTVQTPQLVYNYFNPKGYTLEATCQILMNEACRFLADVDACRFKLRIPRDRR